MATILSMVRRKSLTKAQLKSCWHEVDPDTAIVIQRVNKYLATHNITVAELAKRCGFRRTSLYQYLSPLRAGLGPLRIHIIRALAKGCDCSLYDLLDP